MTDELFDQHQQRLNAKGYRFWDNEADGKTFAKKEGKYILKARILWDGKLQYYKPMKANKYESQTL